MPIEGPIQELGLPDVFQLLDLSRKTGLLRVTSRNLEDEGTVFFDQGRVVHATLRSRPLAAPDPDAAQRATARELQRRERTRIEIVVFELMSWRQGFFHFEERTLPELPVETRVSIATESLLMESARRIDEWSRISDKIPNVLVVPALADVAEDHETQLDLLPHEWEVLTLVDGQRDLAAIAAALGQGEFETAKVVFGLVTTGVVEIRGSPRTIASLGYPAAGLQGTDGDSAAAGADEQSAEIARCLDRGFTAVRAGNFATASENLERFLALAPLHPDASRARAALAGLRTLMGALEASRD